MNRFIRSTPSLMLIDTHAHLNFKDYQNDLGRVINRSVKNGVKKIICVSSSLADSEKAIKIAQKYPGIVYAAVGIHPHDTTPRDTAQPIPAVSDLPVNRKQPRENGGSSGNSEKSRNSGNPRTSESQETQLGKQVRKLAELAQAKEAVAIGECGLDYSPAPPGEKDRTKKEQLFLFREQIKIARKLKLPLIIHTRKAFQDTIRVIESFLNHNQLRGVFHCYSAGKKSIPTVTKLGFLFGIDGNLTYDSGLQNVFKLIPLEEILLETDAPFLSPEPFRRQRNEPKNIKIIAESLAKTKNLSFKKVADQTSQNAEKLFKLKP